MRTQLVKSTDPILKVKAKPITEFGGSHTTKLNALAVGMYGLMKRESGIGIAAPQVGKSIRFIIVSAPSDSFQVPKNVFMCNPEIVARSKEMVTNTEGCISIPGRFYRVTRHKTISIKFQDTAGNFQYLTGDGLFSVCCQHELSHLDGDVIWVGNEKA